MKSDEIKVERDKLEEENAEKALYVFFALFAALANIFFALIGSDSLIWGFLWN